MGDIRYWVIMSKKYGDQQIEYPITDRHICDINIGLIPYCVISMIAPVSGVKIAFDITFLLLKVA